MHKTFRTLSLATLALMFAINLSQPAWPQVTVHQTPQHAMPGTLNPRAASKPLRLGAHHKKWIQYLISSRLAGSELTLKDRSFRAKQLQLGTGRNRYLNRNSWNAAIARYTAEILGSYGISSNSEAGIWARSYVAKRIAEHKEKRSWKSRGQSGAYKVDLNEPDGTTVFNEVALPQAKFQSDDIEQNFSRHISDYLHSNRCVIIVGQVDLVLSAETKAQAERVLKYLERSIAEAKKDTGYYKPMTLTEILILELYVNGLKKDDYDRASEHRQKLKKLIQEIKRRLEHDRDADKVRDKKK